MKSDFSVSAETIPPFRIGDDLYTSFLVTRRYSLAVSGWKPMRAEKPVHANGHQPLGGTEDFIRRAVFAAWQIRSAVSR